jgi:hypothetical protein
MRATTIYEIGSKRLSALELAALNPLDEMQKVNMQLFEDGRVALTIETIDFNNKIVIAHKIDPDDSPQISKTIIANGAAKFYDKNSRLMDAVKMQVPNQIELVNNIKDLGCKYTSDDINKFFTTMQGYPFIDNLEEYIKNAASNGVKVLDQGDNFVTLRAPMSNVDY